MLRQGRLTTEMSPPKPVKTFKTPNSMHVLSTPAHFDKSNGMAVPPLNWDESMISDNTINRSDENKDPKVNESLKRSRRKPVEIKSRYMQAASASRPVGKTPRTASAPTPASVHRSNRMRIDEVGGVAQSHEFITSHEEHKITSQTSHARSTSTPVRIFTHISRGKQLNREDTFTCEEKTRKPSTPTNKTGVARKPSTPTNTSRGNNKNSSLTKTTSKPATPQKRPTIKQSIGGASERKALRAMADGTSQITRKPVTTSNNDNSGGDQEVRVTVGVGGGRLPREEGVTETDLHLLEHQKLQMLFLLDKMERTQEALRTEATGQLYQMWKALENLRNDCHSLEVDCLVKEYMCEVHDMCAVLLPICGELTEMLPRFDKQFSTLCTMLDGTRHYINTVKIAKMSEVEVEELQSSLKQVLDVLRCIYREATGNEEDQKDTIGSTTQELQPLRECLERTLEQYTTTSALCRSIANVNAENTFLVATKKLSLESGI
eukprot:sb/3479385/